MKARDGLRLSGKITINAYRAGMVEAVRPHLEERMRLRPLSKTPAWSEYFRRLDARIAEIKSKYFIRTAVECPNLIMDSSNYGLDLIIQRLVGINTYSLNIAWIEIGTGTTAPNVNDTALTTPSARLAVSYQEDYATTDAIIQAYVSDANLPNATYAEVGSFVDGTSMIGTGQLFNHALISPAYTKVSGQDTTVEIDITVANS